MIGNALLLFTAMQFATATEIPIASNGHASNPVWSPDGSKLAFEVNEYAGKIDLYAVEMNEINYKDIRQIKLAASSSSFGSSSGVVTAAPVWHKRGILFFEGSHKGTANRIFMNSGGGRPSRPAIKLEDLKGDLSWPTLSLDGSELVFVSDVTGKGDIYSWKIQGGDITQVVSSQHSEMAPRFSEGGNIVYTRKRGSGEDIFVHSGTQSSDWVGGSGDQTRPIWSDESLVFFSNERGTDLWDIVVSAAPKEKKVLARNVRLPMRAPPALSSDKKWVAYGLEDPEKMLYFTFLAS